MLCYKITLLIIENHVYFNYLIYTLYVYLVRFLNNNVLFILWLYHYSVTHLALLFYASWSGEDI